jgi:hypothetical protein
MSPEEHKHAAEQWLDEALDRYRVAPPRPGLESRILDGLRARARRQRHRWIFALAACTAVVALAVLMPNLLRFRRDVIASVPGQTSGPALSANHMEATTTQPQKEDAGTVRERHETAWKSAVSGRARLRTAGVKRNRFPVFATPSEQQRRLSIYLSQTPRQELVLIAARQRSEIPNLNIRPIEIKELTPKYGDQEK